MKNYDKEGIFWYALHLLTDDQELRYYISTEKELIYNLYPLVYFGLIQYSLYRGIKLYEVQSQELSEIADYIIINLEKLHTANYKYVKEKPKKIVIANEEEKERIIILITELLIPYANKYCFKKLSEIYDMNSTFIRQSIINYAYDINHFADDGKLKISNLYPFLFTINLIKIYDKQGLYERVLNYYPREELLKKWENGREWKEKELEYLYETYELLKNNEEWNMFLTNFSSIKWDVFTLQERFKALFQLTKVTTVLMKSEISSITMLADGEEVYDILENYLPLFINYDRNEKIINGRRVANFASVDPVIFTPFSFRSLNNEVMVSYLESKKERHVLIDWEIYQTINNIVYKVISKIKVLIFNHEYLPKLVNNQVNLRKKVYVNILDLFTEIGEQKFKPKTDAENFGVNQFFISTEEVDDLLKKKFNNPTDYLNDTTLLRIAKICSYLLSIKKYTARTVNYDIKELIKYVLFIFGPHPITHTFLTQETLEAILKPFLNVCQNYEVYKEKFKDNSEFRQFFNFFELPMRLFFWEKDKENT